MKDFDILDRKYTTVSSVQAVLAILALLPIIIYAVLPHLNPALAYWHRGQYREAILIAMLYPGAYAFILGLAFSVVSTKRGEMNRRALLVTLVIFSAIAIFLHIPAAYAMLPRLHEFRPSNPGSTRWIGFMQNISFYATFTSYAMGFSIGCLAALNSRRMKGNRTDTANE